MRSPVGLCGLGNMGSAVARRLSGTCQVLAYDLDPARTGAAGELDGVTGVAEVADLAQAETVVLSLPTPAVSAQAAAAIAPGMRPGSLIVETSTVNPADMHRLRELCAPHGVRVLDAAILSGVAQMAAGTSTLLIGGDEADVARARPVLDALAPRQLVLGELGAGMAAKVINNAVAHAVMVVLAEAGAMAAATGVSERRLAELLADPEAGLTRPLTHRFLERVLPGDYEGGMPTSAARKDSTLALALAQDAGIPLFAIQACHSVYEIAVGGGLGRQDYASIATLWEQWTGRPISEKE
ncbi:3-hydroxyisobutyrate dehydrogenase [Nonomuraea thailandensis]|uniref:3-hydroxyisobutyrate dehydrogenase n=1 Tax=Nonomuraea thailandensis TaxID=1188745 RepID=A0A9X2K6C7_9ACTN|nr:NAD(P)-dependent oxidoreductase [Nonomuraea thailandensis]MCP2362437.1 3-hydroxyisobutyrate dehydrogenase [Nonomuraea thailandensis]